MGGLPCLRGHRITVAQIIAELISPLSLREISDDYDLPIEKLEGMLLDITKIVQSQPEIIRRLREMEKEIVELVEKKFSPIRSIGDN